MMKIHSGFVWTVILFHVWLMTGSAAGPVLSPRPDRSGQRSSSSDTPLAAPATWDCPTHCMCSKFGTSVNCEGKRLNAVPKGIPPVVETLYLDNNNFVELAENSFANFMHLTKVYLRNSQIQTIQPGAFRNLTLLTELYLSNNRITHITSQAFQGVGALTLLNLQANKMTSVPDLHTLTGLKNLYMEGNQITDATFPPGYASLGLLNAIVLSNNKITQLTNETFAVLRNSSVRRLEIARNGLKNVASGALKPLSALQSLKIGWNPLDGQQLQHVLEGLRKDLNLESLDIRSIALGGTLPSVSFSILSATPLRSLIFNHNTVRKIPDRAFAHLPKLVNLDLSTCKVREVADNAFMDLPGLQSLFLNYNQDLTAVPKNLPASLLRLYLQGDGISTLEDGAFQNLTLLRELYLSDNKILQMANSFIGLMSLRILHLQNNGMSYIPKKLFAPLTSLRTLNLKNNNLRYLKPNPGALSSLAALTFLDMSANQCNFIPYDYFSDLTSLQTLNLDNNDLGGLMAGDSSGRLLHEQRKLLKLSLAHNNLHYIHDAQFKNLYQLESLNLRGNMLSSWGPGLFYIPGTAKKTLKTLDLSSNQIALVNTTSVHDLQHLYMLNLTSNPFACTCDLRWFRTWLDNTTVLVANKTLYKCNSPAAWNGRPLLDFGPDKIDCTDYTWYYIGGAIAITLTFALIIFYIVYHRRWFIRLRLFRLQRALRRSGCCGLKGERRRVGYEQLEGEDDRAKQYDFYVISTEEDMGWVEQNLLPVLDNGPIVNNRDNRYPGTFSLYFDERDAVQGMSRVENFDRAITASSAAVVVLTTNLKGDPWCEFLLNQAFDLKINGELKQVQIIQVGVVPPRYIPRRLHKAMEKGDFREWLNRDNVEQEFVNYLQNKLQQGQGQGYGAAAAAEVAAAHVQA